MGTDGYRRSTVMNELSVLSEREPSASYLLTFVNHICQVLHALKLVLGRKVVRSAAGKCQAFSA